MRPQRVAIFTSASCTGWCWPYRADDYQQCHVVALAIEYNTTKRWQERNGDGTASIFDTPEAALAWHNAHTEPYEGEQPPADLDSLMAIYADDGDGRRVTLSHVLLALTSNPVSEEGIWPPDDEV